MAEIIFKYKGSQATIQCDIKDQLREIIKKFITKVDTDPNNVYFLYEGDKVNEELTFQDLIKNSDKDSNKMTILVEEIEDDIQKEYYMKSEEIICPECHQSIRVSLKDYKITLYDCKNYHRKEGLLLTEFEKSQKIDISKIVCGNCKSNNKAESFNHNFYKCCSCEIFLCPLCRTTHDKKHKIIDYEEKYYICEKHKDLYSKYCEQCKENICMLCEKQHKDHKAIYFGEIMSDKDEIISKKDEFKKKLDVFNNTIRDIIKRLNSVIDNMEIYYRIINELFENYDLNKRNYQILSNIIEFQKYNDTIVKDINKINEDNNINNKFNYIMSIYNKMNNIINEIENNKIKNELISDYINKINYKFKTEPLNLKFKSEIGVDSKTQGYNDTFEVFISYKDNKEYVVIRNCTFYNSLDVYTLLDDKKVLTLKGHNNLITTIRYFMNNKDNNEYLISADWNFNIIIWDITDNYKIKHRISNFSLLRYDMWSLLLVFPHNSDNNYFITSSSIPIKNQSYSTTQMYSLADGQFIKFIKNDGSCIWYLLSWYNKKNNKYYIIQLGSEKILINNLLEDELYVEFLNNRVSPQYSGFLYSKDNNDYLCTSSYLGFVNIWDLYNKNLFTTINTNNSDKVCPLFHIIQWNTKYAIVGAFNKSFKIVDLEQEKVVGEIKGHFDEVVCVKKVYHPTFGESLLTLSRGFKIKLWTI